MTELPKATVRPVSNLSVIWILPFLAMVVGAWLAWQAYSQKGIEIEIVFDSGAGIEVGKTSVMYKGMSVGTVRNLRLADEGERQVVLVTVEMKKEFEDHLRDRTRFWLVRPSISLAGISGLETLVSGNFIGVSVGDGERSRRFYALSEEPPLPDNRVGLHLTLEAQTLGSLRRGSPVFYRQIEVGQVKSYHLAADQQTVEVKLFIEPEYTSLINRHTRFWNASGIQIDASFSGFKFRSESLSSLVSGGIAFSSPDRGSSPDAEALDPTQPFLLYEDFDAAQTGITTRVLFEDYEGLQAENTPVIYKGMKVGEIKELRIDPSLQQAEAELSMDPMMEPHLVEGTEFWLVKPSVSLAGINGLEALIKGNYIAIRPGEKSAPPLREFVARSKAPPLDIDAPGRHVVLSTDTLGSLDVGSPVLYRQVRVGSVQSYQFSQDRQKILISVHVSQDYAGLINTSTRFWNASGVSLSGNLRGIEFRSESLQSLLAGGIAFETPDPTAARGRTVPRFTLFRDHDAAISQGREVSIRVRRADGLEPGTPIRYKGLSIGKVEQVLLSEDLAWVDLKARIMQAEDYILRAGTRFRIIRPELGLFRTAHLETLVTGPYLEVIPGDRSDRFQSSFVAGERRAVGETGDSGLKLTLSASRLGSVKPGQRVTYREIAVGRVVGFELGSHADRVLISILIEPRYAPLIHTGSRFWESSGVAFDFGLLDGARVRTGSVQSVIEGGIAFATPEKQRGNPAVPGQTFLLYEDPHEEWLSWSPRIALPAR